METTSDRRPLFGLEQV